MVNGPEEQLSGRRGAQADVLHQAHEPLAALLFTKVCQVRTSLYGSFILTPFLTVTQLLNYCIFFPPKFTRNRALPFLLIKIYFHLLHMILFAVLVFVSYSHR